MKDPFRKGATTAVKALGGFVALAGMLVLGGWAGDIDALKVPIAGMPSMRPNTAVAFILAAFAVLGTATGKRGLTLSASLALIALAGTTAAQAWVGDLGIDQLLFIDDTGSGPPGRMAPVTAFQFVLMGVTALLLTDPRPVSQALGGMLAAASLVVEVAILGGYAVWIAADTQIPLLFSMAPHTALTQFAVAAALVIGFFKGIPVERFRANRYALYGSLVVSMLMGTILWGIINWRDLDEVRRDGEVQLHNTARILEEHFRRSLDPADLALRQLADSIAEKGMAAIVESKEEWAGIKRIADRLPQISSIGVFDAEGTMLLLTTAFPLPRTNYAYRDYIQAHMRGENVHLGPIVVAGTTGNLIFTYSRRLEDADGKFAGVLLASMDVRYFSRFYESMDFSPGTTVGVFRTTGQPLVRYPLSPSLVGLDLSAYPLFATEIPARQAGTLIGPSPLDQQDKLLVFRRADDLGMAVIATLPLADITSQFERRFLASIAILVLVFAVLVIALVLQLRGVRREEEALAFSRAIINSVAPNIAILDGQGMVVETNASWRAFARDNGAADPSGFVGANYFAVCRAATGEDQADAKAVAGGIAAVILGASDRFEHLYSCDSPEERRWFKLRVTPLRTRNGSVVVSHENITDLKNAEEAMHRLARTDPLTGLANRRAYDEAASRECARARRHGQPLSLLILDCDHFKRVNDTHGHDGGDMVLKALAGLVAKVSRGSDLAARIGGEEFVLLMPDTPLDGALRVAERLRAMIEANAVHAAGKTIRVTASIGAAALDVDVTSPDQLLAAADRALYAAKGAGRNRVVAHQPLASAEPDGIALG